MYHTYYAYIEAPHHLLLAIIHQHRRQLRVAANDDAAAVIHTLI